MKIRYCLLPCLLTLMSCGTLFQGFGGKEIISAPDEPPAQLLTVVPFQQLTGGVILLHAHLNQFPDTLNFILDTGSGGISLDSAICSRLGLKTELSEIYMRGIGGVKRLSFAYNNTLLLDGLETDSLNFHINDYSFISAVYGLHIAGIIGYSFLKNYIVKIDYDAKKMYIYTPGRYTYPTGGWLMQPYLRHIPVVKASIQNKEDPIKSRYYIDIGAGLCLMLSNRFVSDSGLFDDPRQRKHKFIPTEIQGFAGSMLMTRTVLEKMNLGPFQFHKVPVYLFDDVGNITSYPSLGGLIGNDLLRRFNTTLNYPQNEIYLNPNSHFKEPFDYSYTGLTLYYLDGKVVVTRVLEDSPAEKAGFKEGDVILGINGNFSNDINEYHDLLKDNGEVLRVIISREGSPKKLKIKVKSIL